MTERPGLSKAELEVARVLWELKEATVRQVHEAMPSGRDVDFATVQTYLRRLASKGYVHSRLTGRVCVYRPRVRPKTVIRETVDDMIDRLFGGDAFPLVRHLVEDRGMSDGDLRKLRELLDRSEQE